jgi:hypothetical protein
MGIDNIFELKVFIRISMEYFYRFLVRILFHSIIIKQFLAPRYQ